MKKILLSITFLVLVMIAVAQSPEKISYQAVIRNSANTLLANTNVGVQVSILQGSATGTPVYVERHTATTNANGLVSLSIGAGTPVTGMFGTINWGSGTYFIKTETDPAGGINYSITGTSQLMSVPYALFAKNVQNNDDADANPVNEIQSLSINGNQLSISDGNTVTLPSGGGSAPGGNEGNIQFKQGTALAGSDAFLWNNANKSLITAGVGTGEGNVAFIGYKKDSNPGDPPAVGAGTRMMWYPDKAAFRAGNSGGMYWDKDSIGVYSVAMGTHTKAKGFCSTALGNTTFATGENATSMGAQTNASGHTSIAMGNITRASGNYSTAMGSLTIASGEYSTAMGFTITAPSYCETATGRYNTTYTPASATSWNASDRLFVVGNGTGTDSKSDALIIYKSGNTVFNQSVAVKGGKGIIRSIDNVQRKTLSTTVTVNTTINAGATSQISFTFPESFSSAPVVYVANATGGGFAEVVMTVATVTTTGGKLFVYNPKSTSQTPNFTINVIALGQE